MKRESKVAVLLAAYNGVKWIEEQVASIQAQRNVNVFLYISVDESTDDTWNWCEEYARAHGNCTILPSGKFGNAGQNFLRLLKDVPTSDYEFIAFSDQDDIWLPGKLARALCKIGEEHVLGYSSNVTAFWEDGKQKILEKSQKQVRWDFLFEAAGPGCTYVLAKPLIEAVQTYVRANWDRLGEVALHDWLIYAFARQNGYKWFIDHEPSLLYRQHSENQVGANTSLRSMLKRLERVRDGWWLGQIRLVATLVEAPPEAPANRWLSGRRQLWRVLRRIHECRRRPRDRFLLAILCLVGLVCGVRNERT